MLVYHFLFLLFLRAKLVYSSKELVTLDIDRPDETRFKVESSQLDNVFYKHLTPLNNILVKRVNEFAEKLWESNGACKCVYSLVAYKDTLPHLLYLKTDCGHSLKEHFYKKSDNSWNDVDVSEYSDSVSDLRKSSKYEGNFGLNLFNSINCKYYTTEYASKDRRYTFFSSNYGYFCTNVYYKSKELWSAKVYGDRCVAVWAYIHDGSYYMIRLLVSEYNEKSKIITYFYIQNEWVHVHTLEEDYGKTVYVQRPENFLYPNYTFNSKKLPLSNPPPLDSVNDSNESVEEQNVHEVESKLDLSDFYYKQKSPFDSNENKNEPLEATPSVSNLLFTSYRCVDNVEYITYSPTKNTVVTKVVDGKDIVWESRSNLERCVYALAPQKDGNAVSLYLLLNVNGELRQAFMENVNGKWVRSNLENYKKKLKFLKGFVTNYGFVLDLGNKFQNPEYSVEVKLGRDSYFFFSPKLGYACSGVTHKNKTIWQSGNPFDKCVAAWSYESFGNVYYVRLLIQYCDDKHDLLSYLYTRNEWEWISSYSYSRINKTRYSKLLDFYHPEYDFNDDIMDYEFEGSGVYPPSHDPRSSGFKFRTITDPSVPKDSKDKDILDEAFSEGKKLPTVPENTEYLEYMEGKYYQTKQTDNTNTVDNEQNNDSNKLDSKKDTDQVEDNKEKTKDTKEDKEDTATNSDNTNKPLDPNDYQPIVKVIRQKDCLQLDVSKRLDNHIYESTGAFDGYLNVVSYHPPPGMYFDLVTDGKMPLFIGFRMSHICQAVNFYTKDKEFYLAEILVRVRHEDSILHFKRNGRFWYFITSKKYLELLDELKKEKK